MPGKNFKILIIIARSACVKTMGPQNVILTIVVITVIISPNFCKDVYLFSAKVCVVLLIGYVLVLLKYPSMIIPLRKLQHQIIYPQYRLEDLSYVLLESIQTQILWIMSYLPKMKRWTTLQLLVWEHLNTYQLQVKSLIFSLFSQEMAQNFSFLARNQNERNLQPIIAGHENCLGTYKPPKASYTAKCLPSTRPYWCVQKAWEELQQKYHGAKCPERPSIGLGAPEYLSIAGHEDCLGTYQPSPSSSYTGMQSIMEHFLEGIVPLRH